MSKSKLQSAEQDLPEDDGKDSASMPGLIRSGILAALGHPPDLLEVAVRKLWGDHYRVNVLTGRDVITARIAHSYFVKTGAKGNILSTAPLIAHLYS
jgi:hypothetical protein